MILTITMRRYEDGANRSGVITCGYLDTTATVTTVARVGAEPTQVVKATQYVGSERRLWSGRWLRLG